MKEERRRILAAELEKKKLYEAKVSQKKQTLLDKIKSDVI